MQTSAIDRISRQRVTDMRHMYADLMGPASLQDYFYIGVKTKPLKHPIVGNSRLAAEYHRHLGALVRVASYGFIHRTACSHDTGHHRPVLPLDRTLLQLFHQRLMRGQTLCNHQQSTGLLVQTMHDTGPRQLHQTLVVVQQGILHGTVRIACRRIYHQSGRFV